MGVNRKEYLQEVKSLICSDGIEELQMLIVTNSSLLNRYPSLKIDIQNIISDSSALSNLTAIKAMITDYLIKIKDVDYHVKSIDKNIHNHALENYINYIRNELTCYELDECMERLNDLIKKERENQDLLNSIKKVHKKNQDNYNKMRHVYEYFATANKEIISNLSIVDKQVFKYERFFEDISQSLFELYKLIRSLETEGISLSDELHRVILFAKTDMSLNDVNETIQSLTTLRELWTASLEKKIRMEEKIGKISEYYCEHEVLVKKYFNITMFFENVQNMNEDEVINSLDMIIQCDSKLKKLDSLLNVSVGSQEINNIKAHIISDLSYENISDYLDLIEKQYLHFNENESVRSKIKELFNENNMCFIKYKGIENQILNEFNNQPNPRKEFLISVEESIAHLIKSNELMLSLPNLITVKKLEKLVDYFYNEMLIEEVKQKNDELKMLINEEYKLQENPTYLRTASALTRAHRARERGK